ncbi:tRNA glutamyl-Q(34) synthetase GluQRS [Cognatishimia sp. SS12]|uniref:tRNA glutamyl-Q(34) synthetase GluQRS n=1 Tax=Cognatishimia sp. SS12 TaxID=2979465 RepID=UPI00232D9200|nr:tRNA glutamyl-Q(34) synthetase GluQRS [Cognatishimia sp. SS12]MDC0737084.1 tRNA glutamyl-Q(34) synthetase GluQRS [Cognatishimia sp. SS12]
MQFCTRFAPSPTGPLHLGHAYSALIAAADAAQAGGRFLLRIEDIDQSRSRPEWEAQIFEDLAWLGLDWPTPVMRQSERTAAYQAALARLTDMGLTYPCRCRRADIEAAASAPQEGVPQFGPDGRIYPGTCRARTPADAGPDDVLRLNMEKAAPLLKDLQFTEVGALYSGTHAVTAEALIRDVGDIILVRRGMASSYHLSVVVDDAAQNITQVTRGADLWEATQVHVALQALLGLAVPQYHHHDLIRDAAGKRLAKRDDARAIATYRAAGASPADIRKMVGL